MRRIHAVAITLCLGASSLASASADVSVTPGPPMTPPGLINERAPQPITPPGHGGACPPGLTKQNKCVQAPEIDPASGAHAVALLSAVLLLIGERARRRRA